MKDKKESQSNAGNSANLHRRLFLGTMAGTGVGLSLGVIGAPTDTSPKTSNEVEPTRIRVTVNGKQHELRVDPRVTLLDGLRDHLHLTGTKKGCDRGQCGACTVVVDGRRINSCLTFAVMHDGASITTVEGLASSTGVSALQQAFLDNDAFQCGYCTPGQLCSAKAMIDEVHSGTASAASPDVRKAQVAQFSDVEIRERMSGNICRCGAYPNIVAAIRSAAAMES